MKKMASFITIMIAIITIIVIPANAKGFADVAKSHWGIDAINYVSDSEFMNGTGSNNFSPNNTMTRAMFICSLYAKAETRLKSNSVSSLNFNDVSSSSYYYDAVRWGYGNGIISGTSSTTFSPNNAVKRQDAVLMLYKFAQQLNLAVTGQASLTNYSDQNQVSAYALSAVKWGVYNGLMTGRTNTTLVPHGSITRAENAVLLTNFGSNIEKIVFRSLAEINNDTKTTPYDVFRFNNSQSNFTNNKYFINTTHYCKAENLLYQKFSSEVAGQYMNKINAIIYKNNLKTEFNNWAGSCYGMSCAVVLDKMGKIDFNRNSIDGTERRHLGDIITSNFKGKKAESAINYYHLSQCVMPGQGYSSLLPKSLSTELSTVYSSMNSNKGLSLLSFFWLESGTMRGHTVVATKAAKNGDKYTFTIYNPNNSKSTTATSISINTDGSNTYKSNCKMKHVCAITDYSFYTYVFDIDGYQNSQGNSLSTTLATKASYVPGVNNSDSPATTGISYDAFCDGTFTDIEIDLTTPFEVLYGDQKITWDGEKLSGSDDRVGYYFIDNGESSATTISIRIPQEEKYQITGLDKEADVSVMITDRNGSICVLGKNARQIEIDDQKKVEIAGEMPRCTVAFSDVQNDSSVNILECSGKEIISVRKAERISIAEGTTVNAKRIFDSKTQEIKESEYIDDIKIIQR